MSLAVLEGMAVDLDALRIPPQVTPAPTRAIVQVASVEYTKYLTITTPSTTAFATRWGYDIMQHRELPKPDGFGDSWNKIPALLMAFQEGYEQVLLLDADAVVMRSDVDFPWDAIQNADATHGIVFQDIDAWTGSVPSTGVWGLTPDTVPMLLKLLGSDPNPWAEKQWMEQSAYMSLLGFETCEPMTQIIQPPDENLKEWGVFKLPAIWNVSKDDAANLPNAIIRHATGYYMTEGKRMKLVRRWAEESGCAS